jgi:hypothetical protein
VRPTLTPNGRLTARRWCLTAVEGSECRDRRRCGAHAAAAGANLTGGPAGSCGSRRGAATRRPHAGPSIASRQDAGVADRAEPAALGNGVDGHFSDFLGGTLRCTGGFGRPSGGRCETDSDAEWSADGQAVVPDGRGGSECRDRRRDGAHAAAATSCWEPRRTAHGSNAPFRRGRGAGRALIRRPSSGQPGAVDHTACALAASSRPPLATDPRRYAVRGHWHCPRARSAPQRSLSPDRAG